MRSEHLSYPLRSGNEQGRYGLHVEHIPHELMRHPQWVCWRYVDRGPGKKLEKQPVNARTLHKAGVQWSNTWTDFTTAYDTYVAYRSHGIQGIGFVLTLDDPYVAVDLDACLHEDALDEHAAEIVTHLDSYAEVSPSGQGLRVLVASPDFHKNIRRPQIEIYAQARYVTVTGHHLPTTPKNIAVLAAEKIAALIPPSVGEVARAPSLADAIKHSAVSDSTLWERIFAHDKYGAEHLRRFQGDTSLDRGDHSFTVIRLLNCLARWTQGDAARMRAMIQMSPLANPKWFEKRGTGDWLDYQIADAISYVGGGKHG